MTTQLIDGFGRVHRDLRISVTDSLQLSLYLLHAPRRDAMAAA